MNTIVSFFLNHYVEILVGIIASIIFFAFERLYGVGINFITFSRNKYAKYLGDYYLYSFSTTGSDEIFEAKMTIKQLLGKLHVQEHDIYFAYKGTISFTERNIFVHLQGKSHPEDVLYVFYHPLTGRIRKLYGVAASISGADEPCAYKILLSDKQLDKESVRQGFSEYDDRKTKHLLKIPKNANIYDDNKEDSPRLVNKISRL